MNTGQRRFFVAHMLAYVLAMPWGIAAVPMIFMWKQGVLLAMSDESAATRYVVKLALVPYTIAFIIPHLFAIPWMMSAKKGNHDGWLLFTVSAVLLLVVGLALSGVAWARMLGF